MIKEYLAKNAIKIKKLAKLDLGWNNATLPFVRRKKLAFSLSEACCEFLEFDSIYLQNIHLPFFKKAIWGASCWVLGKFHSTVIMFGVCWKDVKRHFVMPNYKHPEVKRMHGRQIIENKSHHLSKKFLTFPRRNWSSFFSLLEVHLPLMGAHWWDGKCYYSVVSKTA